MDKHPSFGYAKPEEISQLIAAPFGKGKDVLKQIGFRTRAVKAAQTRKEKKGAK